MENRCETCRYWNEQSKGLGFGDCQTLSENIDRRICVDFGDVTVPYLNVCTRFDFGCAAHQPKDTEGQ